VSGLLTVTGVSKAFGGVRALDGCSLEVGAGSITGLIGPNGSGKTTLFNIITGYLRADAGTVALAGRDVTGHSPNRIYRRGIARTFQQARVFPQLTVRENLVVACAYRWWQLVEGRVRRSDQARADELLDEFRLGDHADAYASELSYGQRKLLEFAAGLMSSPRLVLLDEPTAGVNPVMVETMRRHIHERHRTDTTFLIVEHDMAFVMGLCDPVIVLDAGRPIFSGRPDEVQASPLVLDAYLGG
jgi:neutral amino acid transport system ATP-binding protein